MSGRAAVERIEAEITALAALTARPPGTRSGDTRARSSGSRRSQDEDTAEIPDEAAACADQRLADHDQKPRPHGCGGSVGESRAGRKASCCASLPELLGIHARQAVCMEWRNEFLAVGEPFIDRRAIQIQRGG